MAKMRYAGVAISLLITGAAAIDDRGQDRASKPPTWVTYSPPPASSTATATSSSTNPTHEWALSSGTIVSTTSLAWSNDTSKTSSIMTSTSDGFTALESFLGTTLATLHSPAPSPSLGPQSYTFSIEISNQRQHVGQWYGRYILSDLNNLRKNRCDDGRTGANTCKTNKIRYDNIEYSNSDGFVEKGKQVVEANIESDYIPRKDEGGVRHKGKSLQHALIAQIADTFKKSGDDKKNCYQFDQKSTLCWGCKICNSFSVRKQLLRWCNAPEYVRVSVSDGQGKEIAHMKVVLKFTGTTDQEIFDCIAIKESVEKSARENRLKDVKDAVDGREVEARVSCSAEEVTGSCPNSECLYQLGVCFD